MPDLSEIDVTRFCNAISRLAAAGADRDDLAVLMDVLDIAVEETNA